MATLADLIETHLHMLIHETQGQKVEIVRSELAAVFDCVPSQINYVLATRFTPARGYVVESQRGSGGHVRIRRIQLDVNTGLHEYLHSGIGDAISQEEAKHICDRLLSEHLITERERALIVAATRRTSLPVPLQLRDPIRACMLKAILLELAGQKALARDTGRKTVLSTKKTQTQCNKEPRGKGE